MKKHMQSRIRTNQYGALYIKTRRKHIKMLKRGGGSRGDFIIFKKTFYSFQVLAMNLYFFYCREEILFLKFT